MRNFFTLCFWACLAASAVGQQNYYVKFPDDVVWSSCPVQPFDFGAPQIEVVSGNAPTVSYEDEMITVVPDACYKIIRLWKVSSVPLNPGLPFTYVPNPQPHAVASHPTNLPGPIVSPPGTAAPWAPSLVKISAADPLPTDYSEFWSASVNCYTYEQTIKVIDTQDPVFDYCIQFCPFVPDPTTNDPLLWNAPYWTDSETGSHNLTEAPVEWYTIATDSCAGPNLDVICLLYLDTDWDATYETVVSTTNPPAPGQVNVGNALNPNFSGGTPRDFDQRSVPTDQKYRFNVRRQTIGNSVTFTLLWNTEAAPNSWTTPQLPPGGHKIKWIVSDPCGNEAVCEHLFAIQIGSPANQQSLQGATLIDADADCEPDAGESPLPGWRAWLEPDANANDPLYIQFSLPYFDGKYHFAVEPGDYHLGMLPPNGYWQICDPTIAVQVDTAGGITTNDFAAQPVVECPFLETDIGIWALRRCFDNTYNVRYCNTGTATAEDAFVRLTLDPFMSFVSVGGSLTAVDEGNNVWRVGLGDIPSGECGNFPVTVYLDCDSTVIGQTHCIEAHIFPDTFCLPTNGWSGANVEIDGSCQSDTIRFLIRNTGTAPTTTLDYIVIEDNIINRMSSFQLPVNGVMEVLIPGNGSTWRLEADQEPGNPDNPTPSFTVEACGTNAAGGVSLGYISQFDEPDSDPFLSIDCRQSQGSYDPNDKQGYPLGYGPQHRIFPGQPLEYLIRFQNTGTDTAFQVIVRDQLPVWLDPASVAPGASSHPYRFDMQGAGELAFVFDNIFLPDSNVNEPASHGFVKFRAAQRPNVPLGTVIENQAAIYFDFNAPVLTNVSWHTVDENFVPIDLVDAKQPTGNGSAGSLTLSPNPAGAGNLLHIEGAELREGRFELFDELGRPVLWRTVGNNTVELGNVRLPAGVYGFRVSGADGRCGTGRLVWR